MKFHRAAALALLALLVFSGSLGSADAKKKAKRASKKAAKAADGADFVIAGEFFSSSIFYSKAHRATSAAEINPSLLKPSFHRFCGLLFPCSSRARSRSMVPRRLPRRKKDLRRRSNPHAAPSCRSFLTPPQGS